MLLLGRRLRLTVTIRDPRREALERENRTLLYEVAGLRMGLRQIQAYIEQNHTSPGPKTLMRLCDQALMAPHLEDFPATKGADKP